MVLKNKMTALGGFLLGLMTLGLSACPPADGIDYEIFGPGGFVQEKFIYFDNLTQFRETNQSEDTDARIYDYQRGGPDSPVRHECMISVDHDHTKTLIGDAGISGKSFRWTNRTSYAQRVKFDRMFSIADIGKTFYISMWVYSAAPAKVRLGAFSLSGRLNQTLWETTPKDKSLDINIGTGWSEVVWAGYVHKDIDITQLGFEQVDGNREQDFYIDDIVFWAK